MSDIPRGQLAIWIAAAALLALAGWRLLAPARGAPDAAVPPVRVQDSARSAGPSGPGIFVHVAGAVRRPGLYRLPRDARVATAVDRAGGARRGADLTAVNLAQPLEDGQQVIVPGGGRSAGRAAGGAGGEGGPLSLGTATVEQLDGLDGIGPTLAKRIVDYRDEHGGFRSLDQLSEVDGIGTKRLEALKEALRP